MGEKWREGLVTAREGRPWLDWRSHSVGEKRQIRHKIGRREAATFSESSSRFTSFSVGGISSSLSLSFNPIRGRHSASRERERLWSRQTDFRLQIWKVCYFRENSFSPRDPPHRAEANPTGTKKLDVIGPESLFLAIPSCFATELEIKKSPKTPFFSLASRDPFKKWEEKVKLFFLWKKIRFYLQNFVIFVLF